MENAAVRRHPDTALAGGFPGESDEILIEILGEIYGLVSGPPAWRKSLLVPMKELGFKRHPLAPCVVLMYEEVDGVPDTLSGLVVIETDDLLVRKMLSFISKFRSMNLAPYSNLTH